jgi:ribulose-phosphate 3-epimerase
LREITDVIDSVLIMSVNPGFGGQSFIPSSIDKIRRTKALLEETHADATIQVDGGISSKTIKACYDAGASIFIAGSSIFKHPDGVCAGIKALRVALSEPI